jgi:hypothetical protein
MANSPFGRVSDDPSLRWAFPGTLVMRGPAQEQDSKWSSDQVSEQPGWWITSPRLTWALARGRRTSLAAGGILRLCRHAPPVIFLYNKKIAIRKFWSGGSNDATAAVAGPAYWATPHLLPRVQLQKCPGFLTISPLCHGASAQHIDQEQTCKFQNVQIYGDRKRKIW